MALIPSPRHTPADIAHWAHLEHYDDALSRDPRLDRLTRDAHSALRDWRAAGEGVVSVSWGKDSVVAAHLAVTAGLDCPLVWVRGDPWEMPECVEVRDVFLAAYPGTRYEERRVRFGHPRRGEPGYDPCPPPDRRPSWTFDEVVPERWVSGVRAQESRTRRMSLVVHGDATARTCRPIVRWSHAQVFAYLHRHDLPVHPAYAMTMGGQRDRGWLRVHALGGTPESARREPHYAAELAAWEDHYYSHVIAAAARR